MFVHHIHTYNYVGEGGAGARGIRCRTTTPSHEPVPVTCEHSRAQAQPSERPCLTTRLQDCARYNLPPGPGADIPMHIVPACGHCRHCRLLSVGARAGGGGRDSCPCRPIKEGQRDRGTEGRRNRACSPRRLLVGNAKRRVSSSMLESGYVHSIMDNLQAIYIQIGRAHV